MHHLAWGPKKKINSWPVYFVNGYKFHTEEWSIGKKTINCGVCVKGDDDRNEENYYYGIIKEIVQLEYPGEPSKQIVLFNCEWFDAVINRGVKIHKQYGLVEVRHTRRYSKYDPFIFAANAIQVYYVPYPEKIKEKRDWWVVIKTKARGTVDDRYTLELAYQDMSNFIGFVANDDLFEPLRDEEGAYDEVEVNIEHDQYEEEDDDIEGNVNEDGEEEFDFTYYSESDAENAQLEALLDDDDEDNDDVDDGD